MPERDLPLKDYDHLPVGSLTSRIRQLDAEDLTTLVDYERAHGNRFQVVRVMESRLTSLKNGARPSGSAPATSGAPADPPSQDVPTDPAQPR